MLTKKTDKYGRSIALLDENAELNSSFDALSIDESPKRDTSSSLPSSDAKEWGLFYSPEGYPYYYNDTTGQSVWAEAGDPSLSSTNKSDSTHDLQPDLFQYITTKQTLRPGNYGVRKNAYEEEDGAYEEVTEDEDSENEGSSDDTNMDPYATWKDRTGGVMMSPEMEARFRAFLSTQEGREALEIEQLRLETKLEARTQANASRVLSKKNGGNRKDARSKLNSALHSAVSGYWSTLVNVFAYDRKDTDDRNRNLRIDGEYVYSDVDSDVGDDNNYHSGNDWIGDSTSDGYDEEWAIDARSDEDEEEDMEGAEAASMPLLPGWLSWAGISSSLGPLVDQAHESVRSLSSSSSPTSNTNSSVVNESREVEMVSPLPITPIVPLAKAFVAHTVTYAARQFWDLGYVILSPVRIYLSKIIDETVESTRYQGDAEADAP